MKHYEMLCVLPGTMTEQEVAELMKTVTETVSTNGATVDEMVDKGKSRLAYPIKNIRYGYFQLVYMSAEAETIAEVERKIRLLSNILRIIIRTYDPKDRQELAAFSLNPQMRQKEEDAGSEREESRPRAPRKETSMNSAEPEKSEEKSGKDVSMEEIDDKLDELLEKDLSKV